MESRRLAEEIGEWPQINTDEHEYGNISTRRTRRPLREEGRGRWAGELPVVSMRFLKVLDSFSRIKEERMLFLGDGPSTNLSVMEIFTSANIIEQMGEEVKGCASRNCSEGPCPTFTGQNAADEKTAAPRE